MKQDNGYFSICVENNDVMRAKWRIVTLGKLHFRNNSADADKITHSEAIPIFMLHIQYFVHTKSINSLMFQEHQIDVS
jgi:hypothetical protein